MGSDYYYNNSIVFNNPSDKMYEHSIRRELREGNNFLPEDALCFFTKKSIFPGHFNLIPLVFKKEHSHGYGIRHFLYKKKSFLVSNKALRVISRTEALNIANNIYNSGTINIINSLVSSDAYYKTEFEWGDR